MSPPEQYETINRNALVVWPRTPFLEWLQSVDPTADELTLEDLTAEPTVYLIPECDSEEAAEACLGRRYDRIFREELVGWHTDQSRWPRGRTFQLFREWFDWTYHSVLLDLTDEPLEHDAEPGRLFSEE